MKSEVEAIPPPPLSIQVAADFWVVVVLFRLLLLPPVFVLLLLPLNIARPLLQSSCFSDGGTSFYCGLIVF